MSSFIVRDRDFDPKLDKESLNVSNDPKDQSCWKLSYADTRRIAAIRSKQRLRETLERQDMLLRKGRWKLTDGQQASLVPTMSPQHMTALNTIWEQVLKIVHSSGAQMLHYVLKKRGGSQAALEQSQMRLCHRRPAMGPRVAMERRSRAGRLLVYHITDLLVNLRHRDTLRELVGKKLDLLLAIGFMPEDIQHLSARVMSYLQHTYPTCWNRTVEQACNIILKCLRSLGNEHLAGRFPDEELFQDPFTKVTHNPRGSY